MGDRRQQRDLRARSGRLRKLAAILHRMWIGGSEFQWTAGAKITEE